MRFRAPMLVCTFLGTLMRFGVSTTGWDCVCVCVCVCARARAPRWPRTCCLNILGGGERQREEVGREGGREEEWTWVRHLQMHVHTHTWRVVRPAWLTCPRRAYYLSEEVIWKRTESQRERARARERERVCARTRERASESWWETLLQNIEKASMQARQGSERFKRHPP